MDTQSKSFRFWSMRSRVRSVIICWIFCPSAPQRPDLLTAKTEEDCGCFMRKFQPKVHPRPKVATDAPSILTSKLPLSTTKM